MKAVAQAIAIATMTTFSILTIAVAFAAVAAFGASVAFGIVLIGVYSFQGIDFMLALMIPGFLSKTIAFIMALGMSIFVVAIIVQIVDFLEYRYLN